MRRVSSLQSNIQLQSSNASSKCKASGHGAKISHELTANSQAQFSQPDQTIIIFDWDDTLCPSTWMRKHARFDNKGRPCRIEPETKMELTMLTDQIIPLLLSAQQLGKVVMVTNARRPWVDTSCKNFLPSVRRHLQELPIIYALELVGEEEVAKDFNGNTGGLLTETKARAMKAAVTEFYSRYEGQSWKNVVSVGDALFEHNAIRQVVADRMAEEQTSKKCRTKTIKLLEGPTIAGLVVQLSILESWLPKIVSADKDVDIDLSAEEDKINQWVEEFGQDVPEAPNGSLSVRETRPQ